jgi:hypothetical protein
VLFGVTWPDVSDDEDEDTVPDPLDVLETEIESGIRFRGRKRILPVDITEQQHPGKCEPAAAKVRSENEIFPTFSSEREICGFLGASHSAAISRHTSHPHEPHAHCMQTKDKDAGRTESRHLGGGGGTIPDPLTVFAIGDHEALAIGIA